MAIKATKAGGAWQFSGLGTKASTGTESANATSNSALLERTKAAHESAAKSTANSAANSVPEVEVWLFEIHSFANA